MLGHLGSLQLLKACRADIALPNENSASEDPDEQQAIIMARFRMHVVRLGRNKDKENLSR